MKKNKVFWIIAIVLFVGICTGVFLHKEKDGTGIVERTESPEQIPFLEAGKKTEGSVCVVLPEGDVSCETFFNEYIKFESVKIPYEVSFEEGIRMSGYEKLCMDFYNYKTGEVEKSIDLVAIAEEYTPGKEFNQYFGIEEKAINGKRYLKWQVCPIGDLTNYELAEYVVYDFEEETVVDDVIFEEEPYTEEEKEYLKSIFILGDNQCNFLEVNGFTPGDADSSEGGRGVEIGYAISWRKGMIRVNMLVSKLPEKCDKLYREFPELAGYQEKPGEMVQLCFAGYPDAEEVMEMLLGDDTEITFKDCVLDAEASIDGKEHEISSVGEYIKWRDWSKVSKQFQ